MPPPSSASEPLGYFDPSDGVANLDGNLPHWRQEGTTYFVTFRTADSLPQEKLQTWSEEREAWLRRHREPHSIEVKREYWQRFPEQIQRWLDAGYGACPLARVEPRAVVVSALGHFHEERYHLRGWVVMPNHVHAVLTPLGENSLSAILHSWKSFTATKINRLLGTRGAFWQKESFDHIVRSPDGLERIEAYLAANPRFLPAESFSLSERLAARLL